MMQEHFYALYVFTVQSIGVATTPLLVDFEDLPYPRGSYTPRSCIEMTAKDARTAIQNHFA